MKIAVIGAGFVGQATGKGFGKHKNEVEFVDVDPEKISYLSELGFKSYHAQEYTAISSDVTMFCVPTPTKNGSIQLDYVKDAVRAFGRRLRDHKKYHVAVIRSTVPPKTTRKVILPLIEKMSGKKAGKDFGLVMQPEYLREVTADADFERPWFVFIGEYDKRSGDVIEKLYRPFDAPIERCSLEEAELQKYVHNIYNATKIAFFNEMRIVAKREGWDASKIFYAVAQSCEGIWNPVYGLKDLGPFDGSCLPKDTAAMLEWGNRHGYDLGILRAVIQENLRHARLLGLNKAVRVSYLNEVSA